MENIYFLGGSPCCGKSTIAERICEKHGFQYYKVDDYLEKYIKLGAEEGNEWLTYITKKSMDELWLRDPSVLHDEEFRNYENLFPYFKSDIGKMDNKIPVITEGATFLPYLMDKIKIDKRHYVCMVPTEKFQLDQYKKRPWVNDYLSSCSNKEEAFNNWMKRDIMFASSVLKRAKELSYKTLIVDGTLSIDDNVLFIEKCFGL